MSELDEAAERWFSFVEEYNKQSSVPLSYVMIPGIHNGWRTPGSPTGTFNLSKRELQKLGILTRCEQGGKNGSSKG